MPQIGLFPLSDEELRAKAKTLAMKIDEHDVLAEEKDATSREYNERLKRLQGEIRQLAKEIRTEKEERQATDDEAPWQGLIDQAEEVARRGRRRTKRGVDGEVLEEENRP
jgi:uncharacterized membrane protein YgaE (UPF0421/DUF939 family)